MSTAPLPVTGSDYLHVGNGCRYRVEAVIGAGVWLRRVDDGSNARACTPRALFGRSFIPVEAAEGLLVVLGLIEVAEPPAPLYDPVPTPVHGPAAIDAEVARLAQQLADDAAIEEWLVGEPPC